MTYEHVIGLEVHVELATESKLFCSCSAKRGAAQNSAVCPACCGMPGMLPVTNKKAIDLAMTAGLLTRCEINRVTTFDKKSYYYPDLPCSYQITQWFSPICVRGALDIETPDGTKRIGIKQIHMEEDAGKLVHDDASGTTLVDFNRTSVPLIEIVSMPDLRGVDDVLAYLNRLRTLLRYGGVSHARWEEGSIRCDVNISVRPEGTEELGTRTEMKNMNSLSAIARAIEYETARHIDALEYGTEILVQETRGWDDAKGCSYSLRNKETAADYRYFPDPNLMPVVIDDAWLARVTAALPEMPESRRARFLSYGLTDADCELLLQSRALADVFEAAATQSGHPHEAASWVSGELMRVLRRCGADMDDIQLDTGAFAELIRMVAAGEINRAAGRKALDALYEHGTPPRDFARNHGLESRGDEASLSPIVARVLAENADTARAYLEGRQKARQALVGSIMKELKGAGDPAAINRALDAELEKLRK